MKKNIAIIMGGYSSENAISIQSGNMVYDTLKTSRFKVYRIYIYPTKWVYVSPNNQEYPIDKHNFSLTLDSKKITFDCVFNAIHGSPGEDGYMQAYFKLLNIPQTSCDMYAAALTFNKRDCLSTLKPYGVKMATSYYLNLGDPINEKTIVATVGLPCFVKANKSGSSYGISKVYKQEQLQEAIAHAFSEDDEIIIESFIEGTEVSVGVITYRGQIKVLPITEIVSHNDFFDYSAKYFGHSQEITPARLSTEVEDIIIAVAHKIYRILKLKGFSRCEFIVKDKIPYFLEINTVPGLTQESILPKQALEAGISLSDLFENAIEEALTNNLN